MTFGSLFAGIGGFDLGLERAGMVCKWQVEIDPFCRKVLTKHWPHVPKYEDVREVGAHNLERVNLLCGGFPCQDISVAGKGAGIDGARSGLWAEYARLIGELRPRYALVENVPALLGRGLGRVLGDLAEIGYDAEWECLPASAFGAPHRRDRIWLIAYSNANRAGSLFSQSHGKSAQGMDFSSRDDAAGLRQDVADTNIQGLEGRVSASVPERAAEWPAGQGSASVADTEGESQRSRLRSDESTRQRRGRSGDCGSEVEQWRLEPNVGRVAHGVPARVDRLRGLGNAVVPQIAEWLGRRILEAVQ